MYFYRPPKSSNWGHALNRKPFKKVYEVQGLFISEFINSYTSRSWLWLQGDAPDSELGQHLTSIAKPSHGSCDTMTFEQGEQCIDVLIDWQEKGLKLPDSYMGVTHNIENIEWKIGDQIIPTKSCLSFNYGSYTTLGTSLFFESVEHFEAIKLFLEKVGLCKLNPKYFKELKKRGKQYQNTN